MDETLSSLPEPLPELRDIQLIAELLLSPEALPPEKDLPKKVSTATTFQTNAEGLIGVVLDPPTLEPVHDEDQRILYEETRYKAQDLIQLGDNTLGDLVRPAKRFFEVLPERVEELSISRSWLHDNTFRSRLKAHDISIDNAELAHARLLPDVAEYLRDLLNTRNVFIFRDSMGRELDEIRPGPQEVELTKQVIAAFAPIVEALK